MILRFVTDNPGLWAFHCRAPLPFSFIDDALMAHGAARLGVAYGRGPAHADQQPAVDGGAVGYPPGDCGSVPGVVVVGGGYHESVKRFAHRVDLGCILDIEWFGLFSIF